ncbi:hypothetical protein GOODEAATRI_032616, partial [Goodea atripinnis]
MEDNRGVVRPNQHTSSQQPWKESTERQEHSHQLQNINRDPALPRGPHPLSRTVLPGRSPTLGGSIRMDDFPPTRKGAEQDTRHDVGPAPPLGQRLSGGKRPLCPSSKH